MSHTSMESGTVGSPFRSTSMHLLRPLLRCAVLGFSGGYGAQQTSSGIFLMMPPLTGLGMDIVVAPGREPQRRRRGIFVEPCPKWILHLGSSLFSVEWRSFSPQGERE